MISNTGDAVTDWKRSKPEAALTRIHKTHYRIKEDGRQGWDRKVEDVPIKPERIDRIIEPPPFSTRTLP